MSNLGDATNVNPVIKFMPHTVNHGVHGGTNVSCNMLYAVSALKVRIAVCSISKGGAIYCVLYHHRRCDILCAVSA
jgi:hypothetical protein